MLVEAHRAPFEDGYWSGKMGRLCCPWETGSWMKEEWWFGYQKGAFEFYEYLESNGKRLPKDPMHIRM